MEASRGNADPKIEQEKVEEGEADRRRRRRRSDSGGRRTRSQAAPEWAAGDALVLVNEIAAVEGECLRTFSSFQKWAMIAENCSAFGVNRTSNQCRRKWDSLLEEYNRIRVWESEAAEGGGGSYWRLDGERRREAGLPEDFDGALFEAIDAVAKAQEERSDTEPDRDPDAAEGDLVDGTAESGSKKPRQQAKPQPPKETELTVAAKLRESAEQINAILEGNFFGKPPREASETDFIRCQGDELIACLGEVVKNIGQLHDLVRGC